MAFELLFDAAQIMAQAEIPYLILDALRISALTATLKSNQRIRGIAAGDNFRRLVTKTIAKQFQMKLREAVFPHNVGLCNRSGTDIVIHFMRYITDRFPDKIVFSIDGVGAFDHVSRSRMFEFLLTDPQFQSFVPSREAVVQLRYTIFMERRRQCCSYDSSN